MKWTARIIQGLLAVAFLMFGFMKLSTIPMQVEAFTVTYGYGLNAMYVVGAIELLAGIGLIIGFWKPRITFFSAGIIVIIMAGAMLTHVRSGQGMSTAALPLIFLILALIVMLRRSKRA
ncbi:DoxX family protein [Paenibacillus sp. V4I5]|uniref:DoxX family protein n=1 Tax=Paenibacillus sp. V4I5 TaxID=3042306 RepID=UPI00278CE012|nr:DoxX family protein [Paenibacillus sp. V4I5]MDQ0917946.1 putative membrane protein YphA (DoxX/SURF4 family) [Paenibacillus sp. V4I5]